MKQGKGWTFIHNGKLFDGTGSQPLSKGAVLIKDGRIEYAGPEAHAPPAPLQALWIDARDGTIMPGLIEPHFHATYFNVAELADLDIKYPGEYVALLAAANARLALECGYTSVRSCGSVHNIDFWLKKAIEDDLVPGPRMAASGREICGSGGLMDWNPGHLKLGMDGLILLVDGPVQARAAVRQLAKDGVEWVKTYPTGDAGSARADPHSLCMTPDELNAAAAEAHNYKMKITGHCRATQGIKNALVAGFDTLEHATFIDSETLDLLLARHVPVIPGLYFEWASVERGKEFKMPQRAIDSHKETLEFGAESARKILKAGGRLGLGGDYGFAWNPHGDYAKELGFFVEYVGFGVLDTLRCATKTGAEILGREKELGTLAPGKLADVLVVDGDATSDIRVLEDRSRLLAVLQGGVVKAGRLARAPALPTLEGAGPRRLSP